MYVFLVKSTSWCWSVLTQQWGCPHKKLPQVCCHVHTQFLQQAELEWRAVISSHTVTKDVLTSSGWISFHQGYDLIPVILQLWSSFPLLLTLQCPVLQSCSSLTDVHPWAVPLSNSDLHKNFVKKIFFKGF